MDHFMESLVSDLSPIASPLKTTPSPVKGKRRQTTRTNKRQLSTGPNLIDEGSVDIYGDLMEEATASGVCETHNDMQESSKSSGGGLTAMNMASNIEGNVQRSNTADLSDAPSLSNKSELEMLKKKVKELNTLNNKLQSKIDVVSGTKVQLSKNISCLFLTCRHVFQEKNKEIEELRNTVTELQTNSQKCVNCINKDLNMDKRPSSKHNSETANISYSPPSKIQQRLLSLSQNGKQCESHTQPVTKDKPQRSTSKSHGQTSEFRKDLEGKSHHERKHDVKKSSSSSEKDNPKDKDVSHSRMKSSRNERKSEKPIDIELKSSVHISKSNHTKEGSRKERVSNSSHQGDSQHSASSKNLLICSSTNSKSDNSKSENERPLKKSANSLTRERSCSPTEVKLLSKFTKSQTKEDNRRCVESRDQKIFDNKRKETHSPVNDKLLMSDLKMRKSGDDVSKCSRGNNDEHYKSQGQTPASQLSEFSVRETKQTQSGDESTRVINVEVTSNNVRKKLLSGEKAKRKDEQKEQHTIGLFQKSSLDTKSERSVNIDPQEPNSKSETETSQKKLKDRVQHTSLPNSSSNDSTVGMCTEVDHNPKENNDSNPPQTQIDSNPPQIDLEGIALTSCVVSNQEWDTSSPPDDLPFSRVSPEPGTPKKASSPSNNTNTQLLTNQTWPFENREATNICGESSVSEFENPVISKHVKDTETLECKSSEPVRAFPISDLEDRNKSSSLLSNVSVSMTDKEHLEQLDSNLDETKESTSVLSLPSEEANSSSSGSREAISKDSTSNSKTTESTSNESQKSSSIPSSSSSNITVVPKQPEFRSPLKSGFVWNPNASQYDDNANMTPKKLKRSSSSTYIKQSTPIKLSSTDYDSNALTPSKSDNILCIPNLIVLGDEETTCATIISPFKSNSVPSEFIPPGVRKEIKEVNTHFRHIRGKPEFLHSSPVNSSPARSSPVLKSKGDSELMPSDLGFQMTRSENTTAKKVEDSFEKDREKSKVVDDVDDEYDDDVADDCDDNDDDETVEYSVDDVRGEESAKQPIIRKAFKMAVEKVFKKNVKDFKKELAVKSKFKHNRRIALATRLKKRARLHKSAIFLANSEIPTVYEAPQLCRSRDKELDMDNENDVQSNECETEDAEKIAISSGLHSLSKKNLETEKPEDTEKIAISSRVHKLCKENLEKQKYFVNEWVWLSSFNVNKDKRAKSVSQTSKLKSHTAVLSNTETNTDPEIVDNLSFMGRIPSQINEESTGNSPQEEGGQSPSRFQPESKEVYEIMPLSPNSCRVTSSSIEIPEVEIPLERKRSQENVQTSFSFSEEILKSPEPDSTSDPVVFHKCDGPNFRSSKISKQDFTGIKTDSSNFLNRDSHSPDSPSKGLGPFHSLPKSHKSPRKGALDFNSCNSPRKNKTINAPDKNKKLVLQCTEETLNTSQVESDLYLSSTSDELDESDTDDDNERTLNATFVINKDTSGNESDTDNQISEPAKKSNSSLSVFGKTIGGKTSIGGWDEMSLMENNSLSEFDRDVITEPSGHLLRPTKACSRTTSISSHISVGGFSPFSLSSPRFSTPSHARSPKDAFWSPSNRTSDSHDSCNDDVRTPVRNETCGSGEEEKKGETETDQLDTPSSSITDVASMQLSRLLSFQELQESQLVKTRFRCKSSSNSENQSESGDEDCQTPIKRASKSKVINSTSKTSLDRAMSLNSGVVGLPQSLPASKRLLPDSPRASKRLLENADCVKGVSSKTDLPVVCRRSPRKKTQQQITASDSINNVTKQERGSVLVKSYKEGSVVFSPNQSPKKRIQAEPNRKEKTALTRNNSDETLDEIAEDERLRKDSTCSYGNNSSQKSVKIVEESSSGENIVIGSCSKESSNLLLKRLGISDSDQGRKSPAVKSSASTSSLQKSRRKMERGCKAENNKKNAVKHSKSADDISTGSESDNSSGAILLPSEKRPLSLQENNNMDPLLVSTRNEFVHNVIRVTRRLDLDKTKTDYYSGSQSDSNESLGSESVNSHNTDFDQNERENRKVSNRDKQDFDQRMNNKPCVSKSKERLYHRRESTKCHNEGVGQSEQDIAKGKRERDKGHVILDDEDVGQSERKNTKEKNSDKGHAMLDDGNGERQNNGSFARGKNKNVCESSDDIIDDGSGSDIEDGEILDDEEDNTDKVNDSTQCASTNSSESNLLHITQDGCTTITNPKVRTMSAKRGKNFVRKKDSSSLSHGVSPMERVYTPPLSSSTSRVDTNKNKAQIRKSNCNNKRLRSLSPMSPEKKHPKIERKENQSDLRKRLSDKNSRLHTRHRNDNRKSPDRDVGRNKSPNSRTEKNCRNHSQHRIDRDRDGCRRKSPVSRDWPPETRKRVREERRQSAHSHSNEREREKRDVRSTPETSRRISPRKRIREERRPSAHSHSNERDERGTSPETSRRISPRKCIREEKRPSVHSHSNERDERGTSPETSRRISPRKRIREERRPLAHSHSNEREKRDIRSSSREEERRHRSQDCRRESRPSKERRGRDDGVSGSNDARPEKSDDRSDDSFYRGNSRAKEMFRDRKDRDKFDRRSRSRSMDSSSSHGHRRHHHR